MEKKLIQTHIKAAKLLSEIKDLIPDFVRENKNNLTEYRLRQYVIKLFREKGLNTDKFSPIVAFGKNTSYVHYFPKKTKSLKLKKEMPILLDMWAHLPNGIYADMTWMYHFGNKPSNKFLEIFEAVIGSRDACLAYIKSCLAENKMPKGSISDANVRDFLNKKKIGSYFMHSTGHSMSQRKVHGPKPGLVPSNNQTLEKNVPYTAEPGLYMAHLDNPIGCRSELDFYIDENNNLIITTDTQNKITFI